MIIVRTVVVMVMVAMWWLGHQGPVQAAPAAPCSMQAPPATRCHLPREQIAPLGSWRDPRVPQLWWRVM
jgi:hypothetical protein